jgi:hypothetical protein
MADEVVLTVAQIARLAGVDRGTVLFWCRRDDFPAPAESGDAGPAYDAAAVEAWLAAAGLWELTPGPRVWREVSRQARSTSLGEAVSDATVAAARLGQGEAAAPGGPGQLAWLMKRAVDDVGAAAVIGDVVDRYAAESGIAVTPARVAAYMISLAGTGDGATVLDPAAGTGELLAAALGRGAGRVLGQDAGTVAAGLARARLLPGAGQVAEVADGDALSADAFAGVEADVVLCCPPVPASDPGPAVAWAQYAVAHLKPGGRAVLALPPSAAAVPSGRQARAHLLRAGVLRTVIALPAAVAPPFVPLHLWVLERPDGTTEPDLLALFVQAVPEVRGGADYATSGAAGTMPAASWRAFTHTTEIAGDSPSHPGRRAIAAGGGRNANWCVTRVADLLDDTGVLGEAERLDETVDLTPARVRAHFSAWHREKDNERARDRGNVAPRNPAPTFMHARLARIMITRHIERLTEIMQRLDWLGDANGLAVWPHLGLPADPWQTATVPELARLGLLRYRRAGTGHAELLRAGDVLIPAAVTADTEATVVGEDRDGDPADPSVHLIRPRPAQLSAWFLAGFLLSPASREQATGDRLDVRQLAAPLLPFADQERYAAAFRAMRSLTSVSRGLTDGAASLADNLTAGLANGDFTPDMEASPHQDTRSR